MPNIQRDVDRINELAHVIHDLRVTQDVDLYRYIDWTRGRCILPCSEADYLKAMMLRAVEIAAKERELAQLNGGERE